MSDEESNEPKGPGGRLLDFATKWGKEVPGMLDEILEVWTDVKVQIDRGIEQARHDKTRTLLSETKEQHHLVTSQALRMVEEGAKVLRIYDHSELESAIGEIRKLNSTVDPVQLADEELLRNCSRSWEVVLGTPDRWEFLIAASQIPLYALTHSYHAVLMTFLDRPCRKKVVWQSAGKLLGAAAKDVVGR